LGGCPACKNEDSWIFDPFNGHLGRRRHRELLTGGFEKSITFGSTGDSTWISGKSKTVNGMVLFSSPPGGNGLLVPSRPWVRVPRRPRQTSDRSNHPRIAIS